MLSAMARFIDLPLSVRPSVCHVRPKMAVTASKLFDRKTNVYLDNTLCTWILFVRPEIPNS